MDMPARRTHPMPEVAAWISSLREAFGDAVIDEAIRRGKAGEPTFSARENGYAVGTATPPGSNAWRVDHAILDRHFCRGCEGSCIGTTQRCPTR